MKKILIFWLFFLGCQFIYSQRTPPKNAVDPNLSPNGFLENVFDAYGNKYKLADIKIDPTKISNSGTILTTSPPVTAGYFNLFFETGSGMENTSDPIQLARRNVIIQVLQDLSAFIPSPLTTNGLNNKVNIWVRDITQINGVPTTVLGLATPFYNMPSNTVAGFGGIADNEVWKTIHAGIDSYTNVSSPLITAGINSGFSGVYYHGIMAFNFNYSWNTDRSVLATSTQYDLYTTALHEVTHALGFASLVASTGSSLLGSGFNYYSRYDKFLKTNLNQNLLLSGSGCSTMYNYTFDASLLNALHPSGACQANTTNCSNAIKFSGTPNTVAPIPVYTPNCWESGSSISHFEDACYTAPSGFTSGNDLYFTMSNSNGMGVNKRFLKKEERLALADLGYTVKATYGVSTTLQGIPPANFYGTIDTGGINVAGINDGISTAGTFTLSGTPGNPITINSSSNPSIKILSNDVNAISFECLQDIYDSSATFNGVATLNGNAATNVNFSSSVIGLHLLRYVPVNSAGQKGNITYIYVYVIDTSNCATPTACNLVTNGDFEQYSAIPNDIAQLPLACGWKTMVSNSSTEYYHMSSGYSLIVPPCTLLGYQAVNNASGNAYAGIGVIKNYGLSGLYSETIYTKLASALLPNTSYQLSFDVSLAEGRSSSEIKFQAYLYPTLLPLTAWYSTIPISNPTMLLTSATFADSTDNWEKVTINFTTGATSGEQYLYLGGLDNSLQTQSRTPAGANVGGCAYSTDTNTGMWLTWGASYYFLDNVSLIPLSQAGLTLPGSVCQNQIFPNLRNFLSPAPSGGVFSGDGVLFSSGIYSFNATLAGAGTHIITYTYINNLGCPVSLYSNITISACSSTSCPGVLVFNTTEPATTATYQAASNIETNTNYLINSGSTITLKAGNSITFSPTSEIKSGSNFTAQIGPCTQTSARHMSPESENSDVTDGDLKVYPNPTNGLLSIEIANDKVSKVTVSSLDGKLIFSRKVDPTNNYQLEISNYTKGIYLLTIETNNGKFVNKKIVKN